MNIKCGAEIRKKKSRTKDKLNTTTGLQGSVLLAACAKVALHNNILPCAYMQLNWNIVTKLNDTW